MVGLSLVAHLPLLRIEPPTVNFAGLALWRMPFEVFDGLTLHAFSDHRAAYEATAPVFLRLDAEIEPEGAIQGIAVSRNGSQDLKLGRAAWPRLHGLGLGIIERFHSRLVDRTSHALALAAPATLLPPPAVSVTFAQVDEQHAFVLGNETLGTVQLRGEADLDLLFNPELACPPLDVEILQRMADIWQTLEGVHADPALSAALLTLAAAGELTLTPDDQSTLCTQAIEALLLPEIHSGLAQTFSKRVSNLLATDAAHAVRLSEAAARLYDARSASLHGSAVAPDADEAIGAAQAAQLLAGAIIGLGQRVADGQPAAAHSATLDDPPTVPAAGVPDDLPSAVPASLRPGWRLGTRVRHHPQNASVGSHGVTGIDGKWLCFAPLIRLGCSEAFDLDAAGASPSVLPLGGSNILSLEDRDIRRDFAARLHLAEHAVATLVIAIPDEGVADPAAEVEAFQRLQRLRNTAVISLRLAGIDIFLDPELLGTYVKQGTRTLREPTVLRQSMLQIALDEPLATVGAADQARTAAAWQLVVAYSQSPRHAEIERAGGLLRRVHDRAFLPATTRAGLLFALLEGLLGRFRAPADPQSLEMLVGRVLAGAEAAAEQWFAAEARSWRNALAHGRMREIEDETPLEHLLVICRHALVLAMRLWLDTGQAAARPGKLLVRHLAGG